jgi:DNA polymerase-1
LTDLPETICTYLLAQLLHAGDGDGSRGFSPCGLGACVARYLKRDLPKDLQTSDWSGPLTADQIEYARRDVEVLPPLLKALDAALEAAGLQKAAEVETRALRPFVWLGQSGVPFDREAWLALAAKAGEEKARLEESLSHSAPRKGEPGLFGDIELWNWDSPKQVGEVLAKLGYEVETTADAQLALLDGPTPRLLRLQRHQAQLVKMYGQNWLDSATIRGGRVYPRWRQIGAASGRTSCEGPNFQQIPRDPGYRPCVRAPEGRTLVKADYATLQMRIACKYARDHALLKVFREDGDPHTATARALLGKKDVSKADRQVAKSANFGLLFGMSAPGLRVYARMTYGVEFTAEEAVKHREKFFTVYPGLARWHQSTKHLHAKETRSASGRRRLLPVFAPDTWRLNSPVQGDEADGLKLALALLWERRGEAPGAFPVLEAHDEIVVEADAGEAGRAKEWLEGAMADGMGPWLAPVPVKVEGIIVPTWGG